MLISKSYQNYKNKTENEWEKGKPLRASSTVAMQRDGGFCFLRERERTAMGGGS